MNFKHQAVRDMAWAISSPPLMSQQSQHCIWPQSQWFQQVMEESLLWFKEVDQDPSELVELLASQKDRRLGKYFETLWLFWLKHYPRYEMVENNVQINIEGETLGEIDFILFDKVEKKTVHWELAIKFYLGEGDTCNMCNWHGPNRRDRLDKKVEHLLNRQSILSRDARVVQWLAGQGIKIDSCAVVLKGRLYFPWSIKSAGKPIDVMLPSMCAQNLLFGWWFTPAEFEAAFDSREQFYPLINSGWLEKISTESRLDHYAKRGIFEAEKQNKVRFPLHVQLLSHCNSWDRVYIVQEM